MFKPWFIETINYLWKHRNQAPVNFDYPDYAGLPKHLIEGPKKIKKSDRESPLSVTFRGLSGDFVDVIQYQWDSGSSDRLKQFKTKRDFITAVLNHHAWNPMEAIDIQAGLAKWPND